ncbi:MAG: HAD hydrolase-like protein [Spirochaetales bacterium]|nr:HAD hydrolase-like protein [Spirochaetales bacterium]
MKYKCLMIDHDDTTVDSTPSIHHPAHLEQMKQLGRSHEALSLEDWFKINFHPGLVNYFKDTLTFTEEENKLCYAVWRDFTTKGGHPPFFPGMLKLLNRFKLEGGIIVVVSHSEPDIIRRHYLEQQEFPGFKPDRIFGWDGDPEKNKPNIWPVTETIKQFKVKKKDILMVDDLKPGITMAIKAGIDSAGVGWSQSHRIPEIKADLSEICTYYFDQIPEFEKLLFPC